MNWMMDGSNITIFFHVFLETRTYLQLVCTEKVCLTAWVHCPSVWLWKRDSGWPVVVNDITRGSSVRLCLVQRKYLCSRETAEYCIWSRNVHGNSGFLNFVFQKPSSALCYTFLSPSYCAYIFLKSSYHHWMGYQSIAGPHGSIWHLGSALRVLGLQNIVYALALTGAWAENPSLLQSHNHYALWGMCKLQFNQYDCLLLTFGRSCPSVQSE